ncbi:MAG: hypothetical protein K0R61_5302 [Microvirga sp.]|nr:hypothetical protein [Microvirga sp.]
MMDFSELETSSGKPFILRMMLAPVFGTALFGRSDFLLCRAKHAERVASEGTGKQWRLNLSLLAQSSHLEST